MSGVRHEREAVEEIAAEKFQQHEAADEQEGQAQDTAVVLRMAVAGAVSGKDGCMMAPL